MKISFKEKKINSIYLRNRFFVLIMQGNKTVNINAKGNKKKFSIP
jgi:hypothetical protein